MKNIIFYIHGYNSDHNSRKFKALQSHFGAQFAYDFMEWEPQSNFSQLITEALQKLDTYDNPIVVGDSTGANFACQIAQIRSANNKTTQLILTSPLLDIKHRFRTEEAPFAENLKNHLKVFEPPEDAFIMVANDDTVVDQSKILELANKRSTICCRRG